MASLRFPRHVTGLLPDWPPTVLLVSLAMWLVPLFVSAAAKPFSPINLHHTSWTAKDGAPPAIIAIAQTPDSWMWLASLNGIYRFDGIRFERFQPPGNTRVMNDIWSLRVLGDGALWIGLRAGGVRVWHQGSLRAYGQEDGFTNASVLDFAEDSRGRIWASTAAGFRVFDGKRWYAADESQSGNTGQCFLLTDSAQTIWARCEAGVFALPKGSDVFGKKVHSLGFGRLSLAPDGTVWATGGRPGELLALSGPGAQRPPPVWPQVRESGGAMMFERDGRHAWQTRADGVARIGPGESGQSFGIANGLTGNMPNCLYQDREGNVWIGTENGLDRFRLPALSGIALPQIQWDAPAIAAGDNGTLWVGGEELKAPGHQAFADLQPENVATAVSVVYKDGADVWTGGSDGLWRHRNGRRERFPLPEDGRVTQFHAMTRDRDGGLWVAARGVGVIRLKDGSWQRGGGYKELERKTYALYTDRRGRLWFGHADNAISVLEGSAVKVLGSPQGLHVGTAVQFLEGDGGMWIAGLNGLFHFDGGKAVQVLGEGDDPLLGISGIIEQPGAFWLNGSDGITIVAKDELVKVLRHPTYRVKFRRLDHQDGLRGMATALFPIPSAVAGSDGKLWFATTAGLFWIDTHDTVRNTVEPPVYVLRANVDGIDVPMSKQGGNQIPPNPGRVQIEYTALSLTMPERMQFLYQLEGVDRGWQRGGTGRMATYTDLTPGDYRFRVRASNNDGVWSKSDAAVSFKVQPALYQTLWFRALCATVLAGLLWGFYKLRVAQVAQQVAGRAEARLQERMRIARDLHDTLLQAFQALLLQMQTSVNRLPPDAPARHSLERSLDFAQAALEAGRNKVQGLRVNTGIDLAADVCAALRAEYSDAQLSCESVGGVRPLAPDAYEELHAISLEALRNAARHAGASRISYRIIYGDEKVTVTVQDDGRGLPSEVLRTGCAHAHWGLVGMRERARRLGGQLALASEAFSGTVLTVEVPAAQAYSGPARALYDVQ